jgi:hypothetical protein
MTIVPPSYQSDLTPENEYRVACFAHPDRVAHLADIDDDGRKIPVCYDCWNERYPAMRVRLQAMGLFREVRHETIQRH